MQKPFQKPSNKARIFYFHMCIDLYACDLKINLSKVNVKIKNNRLKFKKEFGVAGGVFLNLFDKSLTFSIWSISL